MSFVVNKSIKLYCTEIYNRSKYKDCPQRLEFIDLLRTLKSKERFIVAKYFCDIPWNIGSLGVLNILQKCRILTATQYILSLGNAEETQLILNDFLEGEYDLIENLLVNSSFGTDFLNPSTLAEIVQKCLSNLFQDLLLNPDLNNLYYLKYIANNHLPRDIVCKIMYRHIDVILQLHQANIETILSHFSSWMNEGANSLKFSKQFYDTLLLDYVEESLSYLLKSSLESNFKGWKFYVILLQTITSFNNAKAGPFLRQYLKKRLKQISATQPTVEIVLHYIICARAATACALDVEENLNNYANWYKGNISDMKFILNVNEFQNILQGFEQCIQYETEIDYLEIHAAVSISPPIQCSKLVQNYKRNCKQKIQEIKRNQKELINN